MAMERTRGKELMFEGQGCRGGSGGGGGGEGRGGEERREEERGDEGKVRSDEGSIDFLPRCDDDDERARSGCIY
jgi:hypothetical protein